MTFLRRWWRQSYSYGWMIRYFESHGALAAYRIVVGVCCICYGLAAITTYLTSVPPTSTAAGAIILLGTATSFVVGTLWLRGPWPPERLSLLFVVYADVGTTLALLSYGSIQMSFPGCTLLAATGVYVQVFHSPKVLLAHLAWSAGTVATMFLLILGSPTFDHGLAVSQLVVLLPVMFSTPVFLQSVLLSLRLDAHGALLDPLTGLRNRRGLDADLPRFLASDAEVAVMVIDVDRFKQINDRYGHEGGDLALQLIAQRLLVDDVLVARTGGEEFALVVQVSADRAVSVAEWLRARLFSPHDVSPLTVSIGVAHAQCVDGDSVTTVTRLLRRADVAMYEAKHRGGNQVVVAAVRSPD
ncbi:GGDEF domain-containing protein [Rhodococcoides kyotonense]|uniref:Diguanylate cyclase (GGDEF) domain-containing protein n=1 Tax=Rhodococcoides kyotonense TaxID=398843 RepID=A0A239JMM5_9NOCA|nr:GGDEF domain-containing protein [Rhodococcus kyotonensis]SNT06014.1 diguanylate cyclase (GGDEF) domain-containing protein [Rhodococcus kyotonensis]